jgi:hypothetical protein
MHPTHADITARRPCRRSLQIGASPLLLPPPLPSSPPSSSSSLSRALRRAGSPPPPAVRAPACDAHLERGVMPRRAVLERSEFLLPLTPTGAAEFGELLAHA